MTMTEKQKLDKMTRYGIVGAILLVAFAVFYYLVIYIPGKERQRVEQLRLEAEQLKKTEEDKKTQLDYCLGDAERSYHSSWYSECESQGKMSQTCVNFIKLTFDEYVKENNIPKDKTLNALTEYYEKRDNCSCRLPLDNADRIEQRKNDARNECYKRYN